MLIVVMGTSGVGKTQIIRGIQATGGFRMLRSYTTRSSRLGEAFKLTVSSKWMDDVDELGLLSCRNKFFGEEYALSTLELIVSREGNNHFVVDFGYQNWDQLKNLPNTLGIVIIPENEEQLCTQLSTASRNDRIKLALVDYREHYSMLVPGYNKEHNIHVIVNKPNQILDAVNNIIEIVNDHTDLAPSKRNRMEQAWKLYENVVPRPANGMAAYCRLSDCLNSIEDTIIGRNDWVIPETFVGYGPTRRLFPIAPESHWDVPRWKGISAFESRCQVCFVSAYGAVALYERDRRESFENNVNRISSNAKDGKLLWEAEDYWGHGVWHEKNKFE